ncbi:MAG: nucleoside hydrolase [Pseudomonadota bacterium]
MSKRAIIFDTDPGIDDAMAILFAHYAESLDLVGLTTVVGNASIETTTRNALYLKERFAIDAPVVRGAGQPLFVDDEAPPTFVHGDDGLGNTYYDAPSGKPLGQAAAVWLVEQIHRSPSPLTLVAVGRLTNLAIALLLDPTIQDRVEEVVVMGGAVGTNRFTGNVTPCAEANIYGDPHAADRVFRARWPVTLVPLDTTMTCTMFQEQAARIRDAAGDAGRFIWETTRFYEAFYYSRHKLAGFAMHDSLALGWLTHSELYQTQEARIRVVGDGIARGQTVWAPTATQYPPGAWDDARPVRVCTGVDADEFLAAYEQTIVGGTKGY